MIHSRLIGFVATQRPALARKFYEETVGLVFISEDPFAIVFDMSGTMLRVQKVRELVAAQHTVLGWQVPDIHAAVEGLMKRGARFETFAGLAQDESGVWMSPSGAKVAWFKDPDGNMLSLTEFPK